jgi:hypothetical protein
LAEAARLRGRGLLRPLTLASRAQAGHCIGGLSEPSGSPHRSRTSAGATSFVGLDGSGYGHGVRCCCRPLSCDCCGSGRRFAACHGSGPPSHDRCGGGHPLLAFMGRSGRCFCPPRWCQGAAAHRCGHGPGDSGPIRTSWRNTYSPKTSSPPQAGRKRSRRIPSSAPYSPARGLRRRWAAPPGRGLQRPAWPTGSQSLRLRRGQQVERPS